ncbi:MAG TPA: hypothetical protein VM491_19510 [Burkholderiaceae bacterium]|nr:hypothetical protein [Burkholderiaceae bacterium]
MFADDPVDRVGDSEKPSRSGAGIAEPPRVMPISAAATGNRTPQPVPPAPPDPFEQALNELDRGEPVRRLWARALAESDGDDARARAAYVKLRAEDLGASQPSMSRMNAGRLPAAAPRSVLPPVRRLDHPRPPPRRQGS